MSTLVTIKLTDPGEGLTEAEILDIKVAVGDDIAINDPVIEVETAKSAVELPSHIAGRVTRIFVEVGQEVEVGAPLIEVDTDPDAAGAPAPGGSADAADAAPAPADAAPAESADPSAEELASQAAADVDSAAGGADAQTPAAAAEDEEPKNLVGYGARESTARRRRRASALGDEDAQVPIDRILAKPPVRKLARDLGIALADVLATGPGGVVTREDVLAAQQRASRDDAHDLPDESPQAPANLPGTMRSAAQTPMGLSAETAAQAAKGAKTAASGGPGAQASARGGSAGGGFHGVTSDDLTTRVPIRSVRKRTAEAMVSSAFTAPHVTVFNEIDMTEAMDLVRSLRGSREWADVKISPLAVIAKALLIAIRRNPEVNASWDEAAGEIVYKHFVNLGIAAATPRGLIVPNIKDAHLLTLRELAAQIEDLAKVARAGATPLAATRGGTITITNFGVFGIDSGTPILNPGESVILGVGAIKRKPWVVDGRVEIREIAQLAASFDHRLIDGALGSVLLRDVSAVLEQPQLGLVWG